VDADKTVLDGWGLLPPDGILSSIRCPLIYSKTKWAVRRLSVKEVLSVFDLSEGLVSVFQEVTQCPFINSAPGHLLGAVLGTIAHPAKHGNSQLLSTTSAPDLEAQSSREVPSWSVLPATEWRGTSESMMKSDDAQAHTLLWDSHVYTVVLPDNKQAATFMARFGVSCLDMLRGCLLWLWRCRIFLSLVSYLSDLRDLVVPRDRGVGVDALRKAAQATWWEWPGGSTPFFWRWPPYARTVIRDGHPPWFSAEPPRYLKPQRRERDESVHLLVKSKLLGVGSKGYIADGKVRSLTSYFAIPKGLEDIRMVYDASASGLNACL
jgi:hypothetical protein